jgi:hypothetical protein
VLEGQITPVVDLEAPVVEAAAEESALIDRVGRGASEGRRRQESRARARDPTGQESFDEGAA